MSKDMAKATKQQTNTFETKMVSSELFILTYGALVNDLLNDLESPEEVNRQLDKIGYNMGLRLADDFLSKNPSIGRCSDFRQVMQFISKNGLKTYLGVVAQSNQIGNSEDEFSLIIDQNPLSEFVEKPVEFKELCYSQVICGCIRGALEAMHMEVQVTLVADLPDPTELRIKFHRILHESIPAGDEL